MTLGIIVAIVGLTVLEIVEVYRGWTQYLMKK